MRLRQSVPHRGFGLIELLVVIGILAVLAGLLLPAVQAAREAANRARCASHQKQMITATILYETTHGVFPGASQVRWLNHPAPTTLVANAVSVQMLLLPHLEQSAVFASFNFAVPYPNFSDGSNATAVGTTIAVFLCPSDPRASVPGANSYRVNVGTGENKILPTNPYQTIIFADNGAFSRMRPYLRDSAFLDGRSNTLAFSEKPIGNADSVGFAPFTDWLDQGPNHLETPDQWIAACARADPSGRSGRGAGLTWAVNTTTATQFFTALPPNDRRPDCGSMAFRGEGLFTARSYHPGGVNAALCDGSVRWFSSTTDTRTWRALGTRNRGD